jgi:ribonucleoside-diphosphate reductase beta chain
MAFKDIIKNSGSDRYTVFPIKYNNLWEFYKKHISTFWTVEEVSLTDDLNDYNNKLSDNERFFIKNVLAFFAASDGIVNENLVLNFYNEIQIPEARQFYTVQMMIESIHSEQYSLLIDTYVLDVAEKNKLFNAVENIPAVKRKAEWALKYIEEGSTIVESIPQDVMDVIKKIKADSSISDVSLLDYFTKERPSFAQRLLAFILVEGVFFSGSFCAIYWLKSRGLMPGLATANEFISRDENLHAEFAIELYKMLSENDPAFRLSEEVVHAIVKDAVQIEQEFITESLPVSLLGMNCKMMSQYIEYVADRWLIMLNYKKIWNVENPFGFMEMLSLTTKENFFETKTSQYKRAGVGDSVEDMKIGFDDDF